MRPHPRGHVHHHPGLGRGLVFDRLPGLRDARLVRAVLVQRHRAGLVVHRDQQPRYVLLTAAEPPRAQLLTGAGGAVAALPRDFHGDRRVSQQPGVMIEQLEPVVIHRDHRPAVSGCLPGLWQPARPHVHRPDAA